MVARGSMLELLRIDPDTDKLVSGEIITVFSALGGVRTAVALR